MAGLAGPYEGLFERFVEAEQTPKVRSVLSNTIVCLEQPRHRRLGGNLLMARPGRKPNRVDNALRSCRTRPCARFIEN
jgi:hypothetical protein